MDSVRIEYRDVTKQFHKSTARKSRFKRSEKDEEPDITAVEDVSLLVRDGEIVSIIGPSGCGKSTLLNMGSGLYQPTRGDVYVDGKRVDSPSSQVAFMLQKDLLLPWRSIRENVEFGLQVQNVGKAERRDRALYLLGKCHLQAFADSYPHQLSGGMRQRAALARTLAVDPSVLLMDEPFSALDAQTKMILHEDLAVTVTEEKKTAILITHDLVESIVLSDRIFVMTSRPGRILRVIDVDLPYRGEPMKRRKVSGVGDYVGELMELLHVGDESMPG